MPLAHDPEYTSQFFDTVGDHEWDRHDSSWAARTSFEIHCRYLRENVRDGDYVLDAGAGPGRFTIELALLGARVSVGDVSEVQLRLNEERVQAAGHDDAVVSRVRLDICDLSMFTDGEFDVVVAFGGPLSYVADRADVAISELCRVTRPGGRVLLSVMSTLGTMRLFLSQAFHESREFGPDHIDHLLASGDLMRQTNRGHECHMFRWRELSELLTRHGSVLSASATNFLTAQDERLLDSASAEERAQIHRWELELCREPGALDAGTHILAVLQPGHWGA
jgi:SAM-dependent methyltransferase